MNKFENVSPATHTWKGSSGTLKLCGRCGKRKTTGELKDVRINKKVPFCSDCAVKKGFL